MLHVLTTKRLLPQSGRTPPWVKNLYKVHKVDGPHHGLKIQSTRWTDPTKGQTPRSTKWTNLTKAKLIQIQKVNGPNRDQTYGKKKKKKRGRTLQTFKAPINIMDRPNQFVKLYKSIMWTAIRGHDHIQRNERTRLGSQKI